MKQYESCSGDARTETQLVRRYATGDRAAGGALIRWTDRWLRREVRRFRGMGLDRDDLEQEARLAMLKAAASYDPAKGAFRGYASRAVRREVLRAVCQTGTLIVLPEKLYLACQQSRAARKAVPAKVGAAMALRHGHTAATAALNGSDPEALGSMLSSRDPTAESQLIEHERRAALAVAMSELTDVERQAVTLRRLGVEPLGIAEAAASIGLKKDHLYRIESRALWKMRQSTALRDAS